MGRIAMVTRTINFTEVTALTVDVVAQATATEVYTLSGTFTENEKLMKALKKEYETDNTKIVSVLSTTVNEKLYGMTEQEFMSVAKVLPPRKIYNNSTEEQPVETETIEVEEQELEQPVAPAHNSKKGKRKGK